MPVFSNLHIAIASEADITAIKDLLNSAYRGESSKQGWTNEAHLIAGEQRIDKSSLQQVMNQANGVFVKYTDDKHQIIGCVNLQQHDYKIYLGMFSVSPLLQGGGIGKKLLQAAEEYATQLQCTAIYMTVISVRTELINWYERHGYKDTGERKFFKEDGIHGRHLQALEFITMEKDIG